MSASMWSQAELELEEDFPEELLLEEEEGGEGPSLDGFSTSLSEFAEAIFRLPTGYGMEPFSFEGRRHLRDIYDSPARDMLLVCARQVEKCVGVDEPVLLAGGKERPAGDICAGDLVVSSGTKPSSLGTGQVVWVSGIRSKPCVRVHTSQGHQLLCAETHPVRTWGQWTPAQKVVAGERVAVARRIPSIQAGGIRLTEPELHRLAWTAQALSHAVPRASAWEMVCRSAAVREVLDTSLEHQGAQLGLDFRKGRPRPNSEPVYTLTPSATLAHAWVCAAATQVPDWVYQLDNERTAILLAFLWALRGTTSAQAAGSPRISWQSPRLEVVALVRSLLLRLGIPCKTDTSLAARRGQATRLLVRVSDAAKLLPLLTPAQRLEVPELDPFCPPGLFQDLKQHGARWGVGPEDFQRKNWSQAIGASEMEAHLRRLSNKLPLSWVQEALAHIDGDLSWERVVAVEPAGIHPCIDLQVEPGQSFIASGLLTHNSTFLGNRALSMCALMPGYKVLYVSPSGAQTQTFSNDRLRNPIETSPFLVDAVNKRQQNVLLKVFQNQSQIVLRSAYLTADRARGQAAYMLLLDEFQDLLARHIPVIEPATSHSPPELRRHCYSGTPKSLDNSIEHYWSGRTATRPRSTMGEWMVPCDHCGSKASTGPGRYWQCLGEANIAQKGLVCDKCHRRIDPQHPDAVWYHQHADGEYESYRIPQLMVGWMQHPDKWAKIWDAYNSYPLAQFYNEILGLSKDNADRPLVTDDLVACCMPDLSMKAAPYADAPGIHLDDFVAGKWTNPVYMGIDWGFGTSSFTVICLGTYIGNKLVSFYFHRCTGLELDLEVQIELIVNLIETFRVTVIGCDWGFGVANNDRLIRIYGPERVAQFIYLNKAKRKVQRELNLNRYKVFRTMVMADLMNAIKRRVVGFPQWRDFAHPFGSDFTNITMEYSETQRMPIYNHKPSTTDDSFHSWAFMMLASMTDVRRPDILTPMSMRYPQGPIFNTQHTPLDQG